jgi:hypothetical protein
MRLLVLVSCALFLCLPARGQKELKADLMPAQRNADSVATHMMLLAEETHEPSRDAVGIFARELVRTLAMRPLPESTVDQMVAEINAVFKSAGTSTAGFLDHVSAFQNALTPTFQKAAAAKLGAELKTIGKQVRGPEDTPVHRFRAK